MNIKKAERVPWVVGDCEWIEGARVVGRVRIEPATGGVVHALLLEKRMTGVDGPFMQMHAVYLDRVRGTFELYEMCQAEAFDD